MSSESKRSSSPAIKRVSDRKVGSSRVCMRKHPKTKWRVLGISSLITDRSQIPSKILSRIPSEIPILIAQTQNRANRPPDGYFAIYHKDIECGLTFPLDPFYVSVLCFYGICPAQLVPNAWRQIVGFNVYCRILGQRPSLKIFRTFFYISHITSGWYYLAARAKKFIFNGKPSSIHGWKKRFFYVSVKGCHRELPNWNEIGNISLVNSLPDLLPSEEAIVEGLLYLGVQELSRLISDNGLVLLNHELPLHAMTFDKERERERINRFMKNRKANKESGQEKKKKKTVEKVVLDRGGLQPSSTAVNASSPLGSNPALVHTTEGAPNTNTVHGHGASMVPSISYPGDGDVFVPGWNFKITESALSDVSSAGRYIQGCVPPEDAHKLSSFDDERLNSLAAQTACSMMFIAHQQSERILKLGQLHLEDQRSIHEMEVTIQKHKAEADRWNLEINQKDHQLAKVEEELWESRLKIENLVGNLAKATKDLAKAAVEREHNTKVLAELEDSRDEAMLGYFRMGWDELKQKILAKHPGLNLEGITPSLQTPPPSPSHTLVPSHSSVEGEEEFVDIMTLDP